MSETPDHDALITQLSQTTGLEPEMVTSSKASNTRLQQLIVLQASQFLLASKWDIEAAAAEYYASLDGPPEESGSSGPSQEPQNPTGARTLEGNYVPQPIPTTSSTNPPSSSTPSQPKKKFATLGDLNGNGSGGHAHDDSDEDEEEDQDLFAGGEKSGLAVQNPDDLKRKLLEKAKR